MLPKSLSYENMKTFFLIVTVLFEICINVMLLLKPARAYLFGINRQRIFFEV